jgi:hypothetical protein
VPFGPTVETVGLGWNASKPWELAEKSGLTHPHSSLSWLYKESGRWVNLLAKQMPYLFVDQYRMRPQIWHLFRQTGAPEQVIS